MEKKRQQLKWLKGHLDKLEKLVGAPLRTTPRRPDLPHICPIGQFSPDTDKCGRECICLAEYIFIPTSEAHGRKLGRDYSLRLNDSEAQYSWSELLFSKKEWVFKEICKWAEKRKSKL